MSRETRQNLATFGQRTKLQSAYDRSEFVADEVKLAMMGITVSISSDILRPALKTMLRHFPESAELESTINALSKEEDAQIFLAGLLQSHPQAFRNPGELQAATEFYRAHPSWWSQTVESKCQIFSDALREKIPEGMLRDTYDVDIGVLKGVYGFTKDLLTLIPSLIDMGYRLFTDAKMQNEVWETTKKLTLFYFYLRFGTIEQKRKALNDAQELVGKITLALWEQVKADWTKAREEGKEDEYVAKMATLGVLEILTSGIAVAKGPKAIKAMGEMAHAAEYASKLSKVPILQKIKKLSEPLRFRRRMALGRKLFPGRGKEFLEEFASIKGKVVAKYDAFSKGVIDAKGRLRVGDLPDRDAKSFSGARYLEIVLDEPLLVHRAWALGAEAMEFGGYWSVRKPRGSFIARMESALLPEWGKLLGKPWLRSQATRSTTMSLPKGTKIYFGEVADMGGAWNGGFSQLRIHQTIDPAWKVGVEEILK